MTYIDIEALRALSEAATPAPWAYAEGCGAHAAVGLVHDDEPGSVRLKKGGFFLFEIEPDAYDRGDEDDETDFEERAYLDAKLIAGMRNSFDTLLTELAAARAERTGWEARLAELGQRLARVAELAHDRNDDSLEWRSRRLGQCAEISWDHIEEYADKKDPLTHKTTQKWAHLAKQVGDLEAGRAELKAELARVKASVVDTELAESERLVVVTALAWYDSPESASRLADRNLENACQALRAASKGKPE